MSSNKKQERTRATGGAKQRQALLVDNKFYDVTDFVNRHPGGSIIKYGFGTDASEAFHEFHYRSNKAYKVLKSLKSWDAKDEMAAMAAAGGGGGGGGGGDDETRGGGGSDGGGGSARRRARSPSPQRSRSKSPAKKKAATAPILVVDSISLRKDAVVLDFIRLRQELETEGYFRPSPLHVAYRLFELAAMKSIAVYLMLYTSYVYTGAFILAIATGRCGWVMHEAGHGSLTGNLWWDKRIQKLCIGFGIGMSADYWNNQHNKHHATPQKLQHDVDLRTLPLVAFDRRVADDANVGPLNRAWLRLQHLLFAPISTSLVVLFWAFFLHPRFAARRRDFEELFWILLRWVFLSQILTVPLFFFALWVGGMYIFVNFAVSHTHRPVVDRDEHVNWVEYAAEYTVNIHPCFGLVNWWMGYLNFQIEHHLFPAMPQFRQPALSGRVRALFEKHGYTYHQYSYFEAIGITLRNLFEVGNERTSTTKIATAKNSSKKRWAGK